MSRIFSFGKIIHNQRKSLNKNNLQFKNWSQYWHLTVLYHGISEYICDTSYHCTSAVDRLSFVFYNLDVAWVCQVFMFLVVQVNSKRCSQFWGEECLEWKDGFTDGAWNYRLVFLIPSMNVLQFLRSSYSQYLGYILSVCTLRFLSRPEDGQLQPLVALRSRHLTQCGVACYREK